MQSEYTAGQVAEAKKAIARAVMAKFGGDLIGPAITGITVDDEDAIRYMNGATIEDLLA